MQLRSKKERSRRTLYINIAVLFLSSVILYIIGESLGNTLEILCNILNVPEFILGILLGVTTSIPEFITFFESQKHYKNTETYKGVIEATSNLLFSNMANLFLIQSIGIIVFLLSLNPPDLLVWINLFAFAGLEATFFCPIVFGLFWKRANATGAVASMIFGFK